MTAGILNLTIEQGAKFSRLIQWNDAKGNAVDLTGYTAKLQARRTKNDTAAVISLTESSGITLGGSAGTIALSIGSNTTATYDFVKIYYEILLTPSSPANSSVRLLEGFIYLSKRASR